MKIPLGIIKELYAKLTAGDAESAPALMFDDIEWSPMMDYKVDGRGPQRVLEGMLIPAVQEWEPYALTPQATQNLFHAAGMPVASITHELSQPMCGVVMNVGTCLRMLSADTLNLDAAREAVRRALRDAERACNLITRLRALFGNKAATTETVNVNDTIREAVALSSRELERECIVVQTALAADLPEVRGDRLLLQQVVVNLLRNAAEAMSGIQDRPRDLLIRTDRRNGGDIYVTVRDSGPGYPENHVDRLFEEFFTTKRDGLGLGLSISRTIVEAHRGRIWAEPNEGTGVTFGFSIPIDSQLSCGVSL
jgi:signal transduction histidine kinase